MKYFTELYTRLDESNKTNDKVEVLKDYFQNAEPEDAIWALSFLTGNRPGRVVSSTQLREWLAEVTNYPSWLIDESYDIVGDLAETLSLLYPKETKGTDIPLHALVEKYILPLKEFNENERKEIILLLWESLSSQERFVYHKLMMGGFRVGVSRKLVARALAEVAGINPPMMAHRLMGKWHPTKEFYLNLLSRDDFEREKTSPYPFYLASPIEGSAETLGNIDEWFVEWKWDGIRAQIIKREGTLLIWSRGEELVSDRYPEITEAAENLPDGTVLDGEILTWQNGAPLPFQYLQKRIGRKNVSRKLMEECPVVFMAYDILELGGEDIRDRSLENRRVKLEETLSSILEKRTLKVSPLVPSNSWEDCVSLREESRQRRVEGFMLKRKNSPYKVGRVRGDWWKWKVDPLTIDAVMIYAQRGHGRRANLYSDYTFGVWHQEELVPIAKAYSGLTDKEIGQVDRWVKKHTLDRHGPVRVVKPEQVFELAFEGIQESKRHKSGVALRFPRMARWRKDKKPEDANQLEDVQRLLMELHQKSAE